MSGRCGGAANWVPWDSEWSLHNATFHFPLHSAKGSPPPVGQWTGEPHPDEGRSLGKWLAARSKIGSLPPPLTASLPNVRRRTSSKAEAEQCSARWLKSASYDFQVNLETFFNIDFRKEAVSCSLCWSFISCVPVTLKFEIVQKNVLRLIKWVNWFGSTPNAPFGINCTLWLFCSACFEAFDVPVSCCNIFVCVELKGHPLYPFSDLIFNLDD